MRGGRQIGPSYRQTTCFRQNWRRRAPDNAPRWNTSRPRGLATSDALHEEPVDEFVVVTYPEPIRIETRPIEHFSVPDGAVGLGYYHDGHLIARGVVAPDSVEAINGLLDEPVSLALAATEDADGNIDARVCLVLPMEGSQDGGDEEEEKEPWKASVPPPPNEVEEGEDEDEDGEPRVALLPIGNIVRSIADRNHPEEVEVDVWEMLDNLVRGQAQDAAQKAIDDLLRGL